VGAIRVGVVGCGFQGTALARAVTGATGLRLAACADPDEAAAAGVAALAPGVSAYASSEELRIRGDVAGVRGAVATVIDRAREASLPEYEAMAIANRAWVNWRTGEEDKAAEDAHAALGIWEKLPVRYFYDWMALWPLLAMAVAGGRPGEAAGYARRMLPAAQQQLRQPLRSLVEDAVQRWDAGQPGESAELLHRAVLAAGELGYL
jgi:hypothetical protein